MRPEIYGKFARPDTPTAERLFSEKRREVSWRFDRAKSRRAFRRDRDALSEQPEEKKEKKNDSRGKLHGVSGEAAGDAVCKTSSINGRMACGRHIITPRDEYETVKNF